jgi:hypothetical protein
MMTGAGRGGGRVSSPSGPRAASRPALEPGDVLAGRYRLLRPVSDAVTPTQLWQATDDVLARFVAVKILPATGRPGRALATPFLEAAGRAGSLSHPGLARVYDAALEERPAERAGRMLDLAFVVSEWVEGRTLGELLLAEGPLSPVDAVRLSQDVAEALGAAHGVGVGHGRVHPGNVLVTAGGRLRVTDAAVAAAAHGHPLPRLGVGEPLGGPEIARDTRDLAAVLYAMLTARWPADSTPQPAVGLPAAPKPSGGAGIYAPRQVRAGVPRALDAVVVRALEPARRPGLNPITTPRAMAQALDEAGPELRAAQAPVHAKARRRPSQLLRLLPRLAVVAALVGIGLACYQIGKHVGELPRKPGALDALAEPSPSAAAGPATSRIDLTKPPVVVRDYDPYGRDGAEQPGSVPNATDGDPTTAWTTDGYGSASFGGLKPGVGLLVDLGRPTRVANVQVGLVTAGAGLELRSTNQLGDNADAFTTVAKQSSAKQVATLTPSTTAPARYWLVWFTALPKASGGRFRDGIAELVFNGASG